MASRGETKTQKRISAPKVRGLLRKESVFTPKSRPGPHSASTSVPLSFALTSILRVASNLSEVKKLLSSGGVLVNGVVRRDRRFPVGIFDVVELQKVKSKFRFLLDSKGRMDAVEIDYKEGNFKVSKVVGKRVVRGGKVLVTTMDGFTIRVDKTPVRVGDSLRISLPKIGVEKVLPMKKGVLGFVFSGVHTGQVVRIENVIPGSLKRESIVEFSVGKSVFQTRANSIVVVGENEVELEVLKK